MSLAAAFPDDGWRSLRICVFGVAAVATVLAAGDGLGVILFSQQTTAKYLVTVGGCALVAVLATSGAPLRLLAGCAIVVAPVDYVMTFEGLQITPLIAVVALAAIVVAPRVGRAGATLRPVSVVFVLALVPAIAISDSPGHWTVWIAVTFLAGYVTYHVACEPGGARFVAAMLVLCALVQGAVALWEFRSGHQLDLYASNATAATGDEYFFHYGTLIRPSGAAPDPIGLGQVLALCLPVSVSLLACTRRVAVALAVVVAAAVAALALVLSLSRLSLIGGLVGLLTAVLGLPRGRRARAALAVGGVSVVVAVVGVSLGGRELGKRIDSILHPTAAHVSTAAGDIQRTHIWAAALKTAEHHPLAGVGLGNITRYLPQYGVAVTDAAHAHDTYLQFFAEAGIPGLLALIGLLGAALHDLARARPRETVWVAGAAGGLVATMLAWTTDVEVRYTQVSAMVAILLGLIAALAQRAATPASDGSAAT